MRRIGFALGMVVGAVAGILIAPRRGAETRARIRGVGHDLSDLATAPLHELAGSITTRRAERARHARVPGPCEPTL